MTQRKELERTENTNHTGAEHDDERSSDDQQARYQTKYPGAEQKPDWTENSNLLQFIDNLRNLNEPLAEKINHRQDLREENEEFAKDTAQSFNQTDFPNPSERYEAAQELAKQIFRPVWQGVEKPLDFNQESMLIEDEPAREKLDRGAAVAELMYREHLFTEALHQNEPDSKIGVLYDIQMEQTLREPLTYPKHENQDYQEKLFDWLKENEHTFGTDASRRIAEIHMDESRSYAFEHQPGNHGEEKEERNERNAMIQMIETADAVTQIHHRKMEDAITREDPESFKAVLEEMPWRDHLLVREMKENTGFTNILPEERADLPDHFDRLKQAEAFAEEINVNAWAYRDAACVENPDIREAINDKINTFNRELESQQRLQAEYPESSDWWFEDYERLHDIAKTLDYLTRPHDPEFWKMIDNPNGGKEEKEGNGEASTIHVIEDKTWKALGAVDGLEDLGNREKEAAQSAMGAMAHIYDMNIKSDLIDKDLGSYQGHLSEMEDWSEKFARAVNEGTGFIEPSRYEEPEFPQWADQNGRYVADVSDKLRELNVHGQIGTDHYKAVTWMTQEYADSNHRIIAGEFRDRDEEIVNQILVQQADTLRGIQILMRPRENQSH